MIVCIWKAGKGAAVDHKRVTVLSPPRAGGDTSSVSHRQTFPSQSRNKECLTAWAGLGVPKSRLTDYLLVLNLSRNWGMPRYADINYCRMCLE